MDAIPKEPDLERLFREAADDLARYFSRRHGDSVDASRDLVQDTFVEMARGLKRGRRPRSARAYLFGIARKVSQAAWSRRAREREWRSDQSPDEVAVVLPFDERVAAAGEVIATLSPSHREVLELRFTQQLSYAEIAEALDIPLGTVRSRIHHAVREVKARLADDPPDSASDHHT